MFERERLLHIWFGFVRKDAGAGARPASQPIASQPNSSHFSGHNSALRTSRLACRPLLKISATLVCCAWACCS